MLLAGASVIALTQARPASGATLAEKRMQAAELGQQVSKLEERYGNLQERYRGAQVELDTLSDELVDARAKLAQAKADLAIAKERLTDRAVAIYQDGDGSNELLLVAQAGSLREFFDRVDTIHRVGTQDAAILNRVRSAAERVTKQEQRIRTTRDKQAKVVVRARKDKQRMQSVLDERKAALGSVNEEIRQIMFAQQAAAAAAAASG